MEKQKAGFELRKPMNLVRTRWPRNCTRIDMKLIHLVQMELKKWILAQDFKPDPNENYLDAYKGVQTSFLIPIDEVARVMGSSKAALTKLMKDENNNTILSNGFPLRRITDYCKKVQNISIDIDSQFVSGGMTPVATALYDNETQLLRLETSQTMAAILIDEAFEKNSSFVDMQLQMELKSMMACHILDRISRFKDKPKYYECSIRFLIDECGLDPESISNRNDFIKVNIRRPLEQIEKTSNGLWERIGSGFDVTNKGKGINLNDVVTFKMKYNKPNILERPEQSAFITEVLERLEIVESFIKEPTPEGIRNIGENLTFLAETNSRFNEMDEELIYRVHDAAIKGTESFNQYLLNLQNLVNMNK